MSHMPRQLLTVVRTQSGLAFLQKKLSAAFHSHHFLSTSLFVMFPSWLQCDLCIRARTAIPMRISVHQCPLATARSSAHSNKTSTRTRHIQRVDADAVLCYLLLLLFQQLVMEELPFAPYTTPSPELHPIDPVNPTNPPAHMQCPSYTPTPPPPRVYP